MNHSDRTFMYQICLEGHVRADWFEGLQVDLLPQGETIISGEMDQAALHGALFRIRDLGLVLLSVQNVPNQKGFPHE